ncbi:hypothetical protein P2W50_03795 [Pseudomonas protegens]|uniref:hypothetical protein n=1 Tax=Pseudomonas protegens TaxID=380021 RepID=UPI0023EA9E42|nr:hypothetical protein [Pseudomonas protegens]MDF4205727.1 hypothetical protein [Pseudomonas protegens]
MHTYSALIELLSQHPKITSLDAYDPERDEDWFYLRELQNKVLTVKLPRQLFASKAADITLLPESYYKSGYLWKTLFPKSFGQSEILAVIDQALRNIDKESSLEPSSPDQDYHIVGYAHVEHPMTAMRIQIQLRGNEIRSAFPSWTQPWTGNNGKPFSHADTISLIMAESVELSSGEHYNLSKIWHKSQPSYEKLKRLTPEFTITRTIPEKGRVHNEWREKRLASLDQLAVSLRQADLSKIIAYLNDHVITKESSFQQQALYHSRIPRSGSPLDFNACQVSQNTYECFYVLLQYDLFKKTDHFLKCMQRFLKSSVIHTGGIHLFELKRLQKLFIEGASSHHNQDSIAIFLEALSSSPSRAATYHEFNLNTYVKQRDKKSMFIIGVNGVEVPVNSSMLVDFVSLNLGENYLLSFKANDRADIAKRVIFSQLSEECINDSLSYFTGADFDFFAFRLPSLIILEGKTKASDKVLERIIRDYHRMLVIYRQRLVMDDPESYWADPFDLDFMSTEYCDLVITQHKRKFVLVAHQEFLNSIQGNGSSEKITRLCKVLLNSMSKERVPFPQLIPEYIESWMRSDVYVRSEKLDLSIFEKAPTFLNRPMISS